MVSRAGEAAKYRSNLQPRAASQLRVQAGQQWSGHTRDPALSGASVDRLDRAVHQAGAGQVQGLLEGLSRRRSACGSGSSRPAGRPAGSAIWAWLRLLHHPFSARPQRSADRSGVCWILVQPTLESASPRVPRVSLKRRLSVQEITSVPPDWELRNCSSYAAIGRCETAGQEIIGMRTIAIASLFVLVGAAAQAEIICTRYGGCHETGKRIFRRGCRSGGAVRSIWKAFRCRKRKNSPRHW